MIKTINKKINQVNKKVGLDVEIPMPSRRALKFNEVSNCVIAGTCLTVSLLTSSKILLSLGIISAISAGVTHLEKKKLA